MRCFTRSDLSMAYPRQGDSHWTQPWTQTQHNGAQRAATAGDDGGAGRPELPNATLCDRTHCDDGGTIKGQVLAAGLFQTRETGRKMVARYLQGVDWKGFSSPPAGRQRLL